MLPRVVGRFDLEVFGDGIHKEMDFSLANIRTPAPFIEGILPTGIKEVRKKGQGNQTTVLESRLDGSRLYIVFDIPPSSATITVELLYGKQD